MSGSVGDGVFVGAADVGAVGGFEAAEDHGGEDGEGSEGVEGLVDAGDCGGG